MSYYNDLGVAPSASAEEIRDTFHALVRLLHPDQQKSPELKIAAEAQMRRFNEIYAVLSDADRRRQYNADLAASAERAAPIIIHAPRPIPQRVPVHWGTIAWGTAVLASAALIIWLSNHESFSNSRADGPSWAAIGAQQPPPRATAAHDPSAAVTDPATRAIIDSLREQVRLANAQRDDAWKQINQLRQESVGKHFQPEPDRPNNPAKPPEARGGDRAQLVSAPEPPAIDLPPPPPAALPGVASAVPVLASAPRHHFGGLWLWTKPRARNKDKTLYPPEFIETTIVEQNGSLRGRYRARYRVPDRAISPDVNFEFQGKASGGSAQLPFSGDGGAKGQIKIKLISDNSIEVNWSATDLGKALGLSAGTAVLVRKTD